MNRTEPTAPAAQAPGRAPGPTARAAGARFTGIPVSAGVAIGPVFRASEPMPEITRHKIQAADIAAEGARLDAAIAQSRKQLAKLRARLAVLPEESQAEIAPLIDAYIRMLGPSRLIRGVRRRIEETLLSAESAVVEEADAIAEAILAQAEPGMPAEDRASLHAPRRGGARDRPPPGAQPDPRAVPELRRPARRRGAGQRVAAPGRRGAARSVAAGRRGDRGRRRRRPHRGDAARARRARGAGRRRPGACHPAGRHRGGGRHRRHRGAEPRRQPRWPPRAAPSPPSPASASAMPGCAGCRRKRWTARRWSCRPTWNCRSSCR